MTGIAFVVARAHLLSLATFIGPSTHAALPVHPSAPPSRDCTVGESFPVVPCLVFKTSWEYWQTIAYVSVLRSKGEVTDLNACYRMAHDGAGIGTLLAGTPTWINEDFGRCVCEGVFDDKLADEPVIAYSNQSFQDRAQTFGEGLWLANRGEMNVVGNDAIRSLTVKRGFHVRICIDEAGGNGGPPCAEYDGWGPDGKDTVWLVPRLGPDVDGKASYVHVTPSAPRATPSPYPVPSTTIIRRRAPNVDSLLQLQIGIPSPDSLPPSPNSRVSDSHLVQKAVRISLAGEWITLAGDHIAIQSDHGRAIATIVSLSPDTDYLALTGGRPGDTLFVAKETFSPPQPIALANRSRDARIGATVYYYEPTTARTCSPLRWVNRSVRWLYRSPSESAVARRSLVVSTWEGYLSPIGGCIFVGASHGVMELFQISAPHN